MSPPTQNGIVLLQTKLSAPPLQPRVVPNRRLIGRLQQGALRKLTVVSAPAGSGKTTLVCQWIAEQERPVAWYSLDAADNEPSVFYRYLLTSLQGLDPSLQSAFDPLLQGRAVVDAALLTTILNHLAKVPVDFHLVLDDFHTITSSSLRYDLLYIVRHSPPQFHITIITRHDLPFQLSRFRVTQQLLELRMPDLQFTIEEATRFFVDTMQLAVAADRISSFHTLTEGWIVGLQAVALSLQEGRETPLTTTSVVHNRNVLDYLFEEVFQSLSPVVQDFLLRTSILGQFTQELCFCLVDDHIEHDMLDELEQKNLFVVPLDDTRQWYRYHSLFAQMLHRRLRTSSEYSVSGLHMRAARWYADHGYIEEAFQHAFSSNDVEFAAGLLEDRVPALIDAYEWAVARRWLERLPDEIVERRYLLLLYRALVIFLQEELADIDGMIAGLKDSLADMTRHYSSEVRKYAEDLLLALEVNWLYYRKDPPGAIPVAERALLSISTRNSLALGLIQAVLSTAYIERGDLQAAMDVVRGGLDVFTRAETQAGAYARVHLLNDQAQIEYAFGHLRAAEGLVNEALEYALQRDPPLRSAMAMFSITLARIFYSRNQLRKALEHAARCVEYARPVSDIGYELFGLSLQALITESFGDSDHAKHIMSDALRIARQTGSSVRTASTELAAVQLAYMQSDLDSVSRWASQRDLRVSEPFSRTFEEECMLLARFEMTAGKYEKAVALLSELRSRVAKRQRLTPLLTIDVLTAACQSALGQQEEALNKLASCIEFAGPEGYVRPFVENAEHLLDLLFSLSRSAKGVVRVHASRLLKTCELRLRSEFTGRATATGTPEVLTPREIDVLRQVFSGMTNKEIAEQSFISVNTVKTHIRNIYGKLGATTREQAILRARELNYM